jgi:hypothetical protein
MRSHNRKGLRARTRPRRPDFAPSSETPDFASSFRLREATSGKPGGYVGQAVLEFGGAAWWSDEFGKNRFRGAFAPKGQQNLAQGF